MTVKTEKNLKILVLGGSGFVGSNLVKALKTTNHTIFSASRSNGTDLLNYNSTEKCLTEIKPDIIFNCAAHVGSVHYVTKFAADVIRDNMQMTLNLYQAVSKICPTAKIINPLSNCSYPGESAVQLESEWWDGEVHDSVFSYGNAKKFLYVVSKCYKKQYKINSVNFLIPNTFGPGDSADPNKTHALNGIIIRMLKAKKDNSPKFEIWGTGKPIREWAYIDDVVKLMMKGIFIESDLVYPINLGQKKGYSIKESAKFVAEALGYKGKLYFNTDYQDGAMVKILDNKKFKKLFPNFKFFDHKKGIQNTVNYYKSKLNI